MFSKFLQAIKNLFTSLFGGSSKPKPPVPPKPTDVSEIDEAQDGSEIKPDTVVVTVNELEPVESDTDATDADFDDDLFEEESDETDTGEVETGETETTEEETVETEVPEETPEPSGHKVRYLWCLDNGHGKETSGKRSPLFEWDEEEIRFFEYEFNRDVVKRIIKKLEEIGVQYYEVVPEVEVGDFLEERVDRANAKKSDLPKIFVSVHSNAAPARNSNSWGPDSTSGIETWYYHNSKKGRAIAGVFQKFLIEKTDWKNRHLKSRPQRQFYVLRKTRMPAVLTENGFYNNKFQVKKLMSDTIRQKIADAHVEAILEIEKNGILQ
ncbi:MAG: N-acetylmuramoyl-L-alanine amidase [Bacteroidetes bacterium]|nr:N-acetylmuramoyl-L-alanine amidase [Bacteroidota bacterium]